MTQKLSTSFDDILASLQDSPYRQLQEVAIEHPAAALRAHIRHQLNFFEMMAKYASESDDVQAELVAWRAMFTESLGNYRTLSNMTDAEWHALRFPDLASLAIMLNEAYLGLVIMLMK